MTIESLIIGLAFFASFAILYSPVGKSIKKMLDNYNLDISDRVDNAMNSKEKYYELLKKVILKHDNLDKEVEQILSSAKTKATFIEESTRKKLQKELDDKLNAVKQYLVIQNEQYVKEIRKQSVEIASRAIAEFIGKNLSSNADQQDILNSVYNEAGKLH